MLIAALFIFLSVDLSLSLFVFCLYRGVAHENQATEGGGGCD